MLQFKEVHVKLKHESSGSCEFCSVTGASPGCLSSAQPCVSI